MTRPSSKHGVLTAGLLFVLAVAVRALPWPIVLTSDSVYFFGHDAYYHMRRILFALEHFPSALSFDPYLNFPSGAVAIWPPFFDWAVALALRPFWLLGGQAGAERAAVWLPPVLGGLCVVALLRLVRPLYDERIATLAGLALALLSGHYWYSQIGFVDHHAAVSLGAIVLLGQSLSWVSSRNTLPGWPTVAALGVTNALLLLIWPGALLYVALAIATLGIHALSATSDERARALLERQAAAHALACIVMLPFGSTVPAEPWGPYSPTVISHFQIWFFALFALHAVALASWIDTPRASSRSAVRVFVAASSALVLVAVSLALLPELRSAGAEAWQWLAKREAFQASVAESEPLFFLRGEFTTAIAERRLSRWVFFFPFALVWMALRTRNDERRFEQRSFLVWAAVLGGLTLLQKRFFDTATVGIALTMAWSFVELWRWLRMRFEERFQSMGESASAIALAACLLGGLVLWWPVAESYSFAIGNNLDWFAGRNLAVRRTTSQKRALVKAARWLRAHSPETSGFSDSKALPEYGVLGDWDHGHVMLYEAQRPTVVGNFGDDVGRRNFDLVRRLYLATESEAYELAEPLRVRYVLSEPWSSELRSRLDPASLRARLQAPELRELRHHRLIYEAPLSPREREAGFRPPIRIFERVRGARLVGTAEAGSEVEGSLELRGAPGGARRARSITKAGPDGRFVLTVAHPSGASLVEVQAAPAWVLSNGDKTTQIVVSIRDVRNGSELRIPPFSNSGD